MGTNIHRRWIIEINGYSQSPHSQWFTQSPAYLSQASQGPIRLASSSFTHHIAFKGPENQLSARQKRHLYAVCSCCLIMGVVGGSLLAGIPEHIRVNGLTCYDAMCRWGTAGRESAKEKLGFENVGKAQAAAKIGGPWCFRFSGRPSTWRHQRARHRSLFFWVSKTGDRSRH